jgi:hypothetical protein
MQNLCSFNRFSLGTTPTCALNFYIIFYYFAAPGAVATKNPEPSYAGAADTYAVVDIGGHQLIVEEGRWYTVNRLEVRRNCIIKMLIDQ